ncbi:hypothetical protein MTO96_034015 [Rhipicephalus appendiculatus]
MPFSLGRLVGPTPSRATEESLLGESLLGKSSLEESLLEKSSLEESLLGESSLEESLQGESSLEESLQGESSLEESLLEESSLEESLLEESSLEESPLEESSLESFVESSTLSSCSRKRAGDKLREYPSLHRPILLDSLVKKWTWYVEYSSRNDFSSSDSFSNESSSEDFYSDGS